VADTTDTVLEVEGLGHSFGGVRAVDDISFAVRRGEIFGVIGPNGAGKSTLFSLIAGSTRAREGSVTILGHRADRLTPSRRSRPGPARTFQSSQVFTDSTVGGNLDIARVAHHRRTGPERREEVARLIGLEHALAKPAALLSVYEQQRLAIGMALMSAPDVLLLDEPSGGLVEQEVMDLLHLLRRINAEGVTLVVIDHKMRLMTRLCDRILAMASGAHLCLGTPDEVVADAGVRTAYLGERGAVA